MTKSNKSIAGLAVAIIVVAIIFFATKGGPSSPVTSSETSASPAIASNSAPVSGAAWLSLVAPLSGIIDAGQAQTVEWTSTNYSLSTVQVALIRKVSDNPARYELVRMIAPATHNDGSATWVPAVKDIGTGLSIEVGCTLGPQACTASKVSPQLAVVNDGKYMNAASAFQAIEAAQNQ